MSKPLKRRPGVPDRPLTTATEADTSHRLGAAHDQPTREQPTHEQSTHERAVQSSVSLRPSQWKRLDIVGDLTRWGRSETLSQAVDLLTSLPIPVTQRLATLSRTTVRGTLQERLQAAIEQAIAAAEAELSDSPWAEFDASLMAAGEEFRQSGAADSSEAELMAAAERGKQEYRRERRRGLGSGTSRD